VFLDRTIPLAHPEFALVEGHCRHPGRDRMPSKFALISNCGFYELDNFDALVLHCERMCLNFQCRYSGHVLRPHGPMLRYPELLAGPIGDVLKAAETAGEELVTRGEISQATMEAAHKEMLPKEAYVQGANAYWLQELERYSKKRLKG